MTDEQPAGGRDAVRRGRWSVLAAAWGALDAILPHALHHLVPAVGGALLAGATGAVLFGVIGLVLMIPFLLRRRRHFGTWLAPAAAIGLFGAVFLTSTVLIGPVIRGATSNPGAAQTHDPSHSGEHPHP